MTSMQPAPAIIGASVKRPPLNERANVLGATVDRLDEALRNLMDRLEPVLLPREGAIAADTASNLASPPESWLAGYLDHITAKVDELGTVVHSITARVDL